MPEKKSSAKADKPADERKQQENLLSMLGKSWRDYNSTQIDFAEQNAKAYFTAMRKVLDAKNISDAATVYTKFARVAGERQMEQARTLGKMALDTTRSVGSKAVSALRNRTAE